MGAQQASANDFWQDDTTLTNKAIHFDSKQGNKKPAKPTIVSMVKERD